MENQDFKFFTNTKYSDLKKVLSNYVVELKKNKNVLGAVLTGSTSRGDRDSYSDIDIAVFVKRKEISLQEGKFDFQGHLFDVRICEFYRIQQIEWTCDMYFAYLNSSLIYDSTNNVSELIAGKWKEWFNSYVTHVILSLVQLSSIIEFKDNWRGLFAKTHYRKFISRGDSFSVHRVLNLGFEFILDLFYLLQEKPPPDYKNKLRLLENMTNISSGNLSLVKEFAQANSSGLFEAERKYEILIQLTESIKNAVNSSNQSFPDDFYRFYIVNRI